MQPRSPQAPLQWVAKYAWDSPGRINGADLYRTAEQCFHQHMIVY